MVLSKCVCAPRHVWLLQASCPASLAASASMCLCLRGVRAVGRRAVHSPVVEAAIRAERAAGPCRTPACSRCGTSQRSSRDRPPRCGPHLPCWRQPSGCATRRPHRGRRGRTHAESADRARPTPRRSPRGLGTEEHAIGKSGRAPCGADALRSHLDRRMRPLVGDETHPSTLNLRVPALKGRLLPRPEHLHQTETLRAWARGPCGSDRRFSAPARGSRSRCRARTGRG
jgi:hypothetical protein